MSEVGTQSGREQGVERLRSSLARRRKGGGAGMPADRILVLAGTLAIPLGMVAILLGWYGASRTPYTFEQIPYVASGGLLGLALVIAGGFFYFGAWVARGVQEARRQGEETREALARIEQLLSGRAFAPSPYGGEGAEASSAVVPAAAPRGRSGADSPVRIEADVVRTVGLGGGNGTGTLVATARGTTVHAVDCPVVQGREGLRTVDAEDTGDLTPCKLCAPLD